jgi:hypothetical protein
VTMRHACHRPAARRWCGRAIRYRLGGASARAAADTQATAAPRAAAAETAVACGTSRNRVPSCDRTSGQDSVTPPPTPTDVVAPTSEPPAGAIADVLARINAARAAGFRCDGTSGPALPPIGYSAELGELARWHADDFAAGRTSDFIADLNRSGYGGAFVGQSAVLCLRCGAAGVFTAERLGVGCVHLFAPRSTGSGSATPTVTTPEHLGADVWSWQQPVMGPGRVGS